LCLFFFLEIAGSEKEDVKNISLLLAGSDLGSGETNLLTLDKDLFIVAVIAHEQVLFKLCLDGIMVKDIDGRVLDGGVDQDGIKLLADLKVTNGLFQLHDASASDGGEVKQLGDDQGRFHVAGDGTGAGGAQGFEDGGGVTTGDIGAETDLDVLVQHLADIGHAGLEVEVGIGTVRDTGVLFLHEVQFFILHVDAMGHDGAFVQETVVGIDGGVVDRFGEEGHGEPNLVHVLAEMRLNGEIVLGRQLTQLSQQLGVARDGETRGDDGGDQGGGGRGSVFLGGRVGGLGVLDESTGVADRGLGGLDQEIGRVLVHVDLADIGTLTLLKDNIHELLAGLEVDGGEPTSRSGSVPERTGHGLGVELAGIVSVGKLALTGESVGIQPFEQRQVVSVSTEGVLRSMLCVVIDRFKLVRNTPKIGNSLFPSEQKLKVT